MFHGNEIGTIGPWVSPPENEIDTNLYMYFEAWFFEIMQLLQEFSGNFKIFWYTMRFEG